MENVLKFNFNVKYNIKIIIYKYIIYYSMLLNYLTN